MSEPIATAGRRRRQLPIVAVGVIAACNYFQAIAGAQGMTQKDVGKTAQTAPDRPAILPDRRSEEDWSVLADPRVAREPLDRLKYVPLLYRHVWGGSRGLEDHAALLGGN
jgi:hypothetical protein